MPAEQAARQTIDNLLTQAGWTMQDVGYANGHASRGVAVRGLPLNEGLGFADHALYGPHRPLAFAERAA